MKQIITPSKTTQVVKTLTTIASAYFGIVMITVVLTIPTKAVWMLISFLWNSF